jgi:hypothetical protein
VIFIVTNPNYPPRGTAEQIKEGKYALNLASNI